MIQSTFNYLRNPIWIVNGPSDYGSTRVESIALKLLEPARFLIRELGYLPVREWSAKTNNTDHDLGLTELCTLPDLPSQESQKITPSLVVKKICRIVRLVFAALAAALITPLGLVLHQLALATSEEVRKNYEELEEWKNYPGLVAAKTKNFNDLRDLIAKIAPTEYGIFFKSTPAGHSTLKTLLVDSGESMETHENAIHILISLIRNWEGENFHEYFSSPLLLKWIINNSSETLLEALLSKYEGKLETFFGQTLEGNTLLDLAVTSYYSRWGHREFPLLLVERCPTEDLMLLLGPKTDVLLWPSQVLIALLRKSPPSKVDDCLGFTKNGRGSFIREAISSRKSDVVQALFEIYPRETIATLYQPTAEEETLWDLVVKTDDLGIASDRLATTVLEMCPQDSLNLLISPSSNPLKWSSTRKAMFSRKIEGVIFDGGVEEVKAFLTHIDKDGSTVLHRKNQRDFFQIFTEAVNIEISKVYNKEGLSPCDLNSYTLSLDWLKQPKYNSLAANQISQGEYHQRANTLKSEVFRLWDSVALELAHRRIPSTLLIIGGDRKSSPEIKLKLGRMLDKIVTKEAWVGTPRSADSKGLHSFYSEMLLNFECVIAFLKQSGDFLEAAGYLIDIAKVEFEGRCAAAYQEEIEQKALLCTQDETESSVEQIFNRAAIKALRSLVDNILRKKSQGAVDVHYSRRLSYACGLAITSDPLDSGRQGFQGRVSESYRDLANAFDLTDFIQEISRDIENEMAIDLTKNLIPGIKGLSLFERIRHKANKIVYGVGFYPKTTDELYRKVILKAQKKESALKNKILGQLPPLVEQKIFRLWSSSHEDEAVFLAIQELRTTRLPSLAQGEDLIEKIISEETAIMRDLSSCPELDLGSYFSGHSLNHEKEKEAVIEFLKTKNKYSPLSRLKIHNQLSQMIIRIDRAKKFLDAVEPLLSDQRVLSSIVEIQRKYQSDLAAIIEELTPNEESEELDLAFDQNSYLWPSQAFENNYKNWKGQDDFSYKGRMLLKLLTALGILTKK